MKKVIAIIMAASMMFAFSACGKKGSDVTQANMKKVEGQEAKAVDSSSNEAVSTEKATTTDEKDSDTQGTEAKESNSTGNATISVDDNAASVTIENAKIVDTEDGKVIVVSFEFSNNTSNEKTFDGLFQVSATQNDSTLNGAVVNVDGVDPQSALTMIKSGGKVTVQKVYQLDNNENDVLIETHEYGAAEKGNATKTFSVK